MIKKTLTLVIMFLALASFAYAGDSVNIGIGATIPAIPGINAPALSIASSSATAVKSDSGSADTQNTQRKERNLTEDAGFSVIVKSQQTDSGTVETVYSR